MNCDEALDSGREIKRAASLLFSPGDVVEVRALSDFKTYSGYFKDFDKLAAEAVALESSGVNGVYVTLNNVNPVLISRRAERVKCLSKKDASTSDADILRRRFLPVDIDPVRPSGLSSSDDEHDYALFMAERVAGFLEELGFPVPLFADSGNGAHLLYRINLPNDGDCSLLVKHCLEVLDALFSDSRAVVDKGNYNASRIWKLYGTYARKGDDTADRPHRRSGIISVPDDFTVVSKDKLVKLSEFIPGRNKRKIPAINSTGMKKGIDLGEWLSSNGILVKSEKPWQGGTLFVLDDCPFSSAHSDGAFAVQFGNGAVFAGCHHNSCGAGEQRWSELRGMYEKKAKPVKRKVAAEPDLHARALDILSNGDPVKADPDLHAQALNILSNGDPLKFMLDTFSKCHIGDRIVAECMIMSVASQSVDNTMGLHVSVSGNSGKGKTHVCKSMLRLIPDEFKLSGSVSDKALFYNPDLRAGTVFWFDDTALSEDFQEVLKNATSNFESRIEHMTLTTERKLKVCSIPERCVWWLSKVDDAGDDQVLNRMLTVWIDDSAEQDGKVLEYLRTAETKLKKDVSDEGDILVCREIWRILKESHIYVTIPYSERIRFLGFSNRRNPSVLFDLIKCHALLFSFKRREVDDVPGVKTIEADLSDFYAALEVYRKIDRDSGDMTSNLSKNEANVLSLFETMKWSYANMVMVQDSLAFSYYQVRRVFHGYISKGNRYPGLLDKCPAVSYEDVVIPEDSEAGTVRKRERRYLFNYEVYRGWINSCSVVLDDLPGFGGECRGQCKDDPGSGKSCSDKADGCRPEKSDGEGVTVADSCQDDTFPVVWQCLNGFGTPSAVPDYCGYFKNLPDVCGLFGSGDRVRRTFPGTEDGFLFRGSAVLDDCDFPVSGPDAMYVKESVYSRFFRDIGYLRSLLYGVPVPLCGATSACDNSDVSYRKSGNEPLPGFGSDILPFNYGGSGNGRGVSIDGESDGGNCIAKISGKGMGVYDSSSFGSRKIVKSNVWSNPRYGGSAIPLPGLFKSKDFSVVSRDLGACHICGKGKVRFRCEELRLNICDECMMRIIRRERER